MGRPRKFGVEREKNGRPKRAPAAVAKEVKDLGTERVQAMRAILANGFDQALTSTAMGILYCQYHDRGVRPLERHHYDAAMRYQWVHNAIFGRPHATAQKLESCIGHAKAGDFSTKIDSMSDKGARDAVADYRAVCGEGGPLVAYEDREMFNSVVVYEHLPPWAGGVGVLHDRLYEDFWRLAEAVAVALNYGGGK